MTEAEWRNRADFAPFAEALGITTDCVMSAAKSAGNWMILYTETPTVEDDSWVWMGVLYPDSDGILNVARRSKIKTFAEFKTGLREHMEGRNHGAV